MTWIATFGVPYNFGFFLQAIGYVGGTNLVQNSMQLALLNVAAPKKKLMMSKRAPGSDLCLATRQEGTRRVPFEILGAFVDDGTWSVYAS
ncbi:hypothetical protein HBI81_077190 [Parastagonospora nodorum]|nr:hypothetical protein HBI81_077190 [Parastagonospora nodorum]